MRDTHEPVRLRRRTTRTGLQSLYLDIYIDGQRSYEYLHLYLSGGTSREERDRDAETLRLAEAVRAKRLVEVRNGEYGFLSARGDIRLLDLFAAMCEERRAEEGTYRTWTGCLSQLRAYGCREGVLVGDITAQWCERFLHYLLYKAVTAQKGRVGVPLSHNTAVTYFAKFRCCLRRAVKDGIIDRSPADGVQVPGAREAERQYLTIDELRRLASVQCRDEGVRRTFLLSCLTGLRYGDIYALRWRDIREQDGRVRIVFRQRKTDGQEYADIAPQAVGLLPERGEPDGVVFRHRDHQHVNNVIGDWVRAAGIAKHITFHCARHTFATMLLASGTDIYTVSKLLGHRDLSTTQIYARIVDSAKREAVDRLPHVLPD